MFENTLVHVSSTELRVATGGLNLEHPFSELHDRYIQGTATQVDYCDTQFLAQPVQSISQRSSGRFVDKAHDFQPGNSTGILGGSALIVIEIGGHRHHRLCHGFAQEGFGIALDLLQQEGGKLLGRVFALPETNDFTLAHLALEGAGGSFRISRCLAARRFAYQDLSVSCECDAAGERLAAYTDALGARDDNGPAAAQNRGC